jgi:hypothetical protein
MSKSIPTKESIESLRRSGAEATTGTTSSLNIGKDVAVHVRKDKGMGTMAKRGCSGAVQADVKCGEVEKERMR